MERTLFAQKNLNKMESITYKDPTEFLESNPAAFYLVLIMDNHGRSYSWKGDGWQLFDEVGQDSFLDVSAFPAKNAEERFYSALRSAKETFDAGNLWLIPIPILPFTGAW